MKKRRVNLVGVDYTKLDDSERRIRCQEEVELVLKKYHCAINPVVTLTGLGIKGFGIEVVPLKPEQIKTP